jgi:hypothetical protein
MRDYIGTRLENGTPGINILAALNPLPPVQRLLASEFDGRPITEQNLSEWKAGGHQDWLRQQEVRRLAEKLTEQAGDIDDAADGLGLSDRLASVLSLQLAQVALALLEQEPDLEKRWQRLCQINRELARLRREDHRARHLQIERERWEAQQHEQAEREEEKFQQQRARRSDPFLQALAQMGSPGQQPNAAPAKPEPRPRPPGKPAHRTPRRHAAKPKPASNAMMTGCKLRPDTFTPRIG